MGHATLRPKKPNSLAGASAFKPYCHKCTNPHLRVNMCADSLAGASSYKTSLPQMYEPAPAGE